MDTSQKHILIVEDERPLAHALQLKLTHEGFAVTVVNNGRECLELLKTQKFDLALMDLMMPEVDGFQVLEELQDKPEKPTIFILSNLSQQEDEDRVLALGARKFFIKSDTPLTVIVAEIHKIFGEKPAQAAA